MPLQIVLGDYTTPLPLGGAGVTGSLLDYLADYYFLVGTDNASSILNRASDKPLQGEIVGTPTYGTNYGRFGPDNFLRSTGGVGGPSTFVVAVRKVGNERLTFGTYDLGAGTGFLGYMPNGTLFETGVNGGFANTSFTLADGQFYFIAITFDGVNYKLSIFGNGVIIASAAGVRNNTTLAPAKFKLGGLASGLGQGDFAAALSYPLSLTTDELTGVYNALKPVLAGRNVSIA